MESPAGEQDNAECRMQNAEMWNRLRAMDFKKIRAGTLAHRVTDFFNAECRMQKYGIACGRWILKR